MKSVLCYGDSNTWGSDPAEATRRFPRDVRWPWVLQSELGDGFHVIEEGLGDRTTVLDDPLIPGRNGMATLVPCLEAHAPLDLVVIMLGTNDISYPTVTASATADGAGMLAHLVLRSVFGPDGIAPRALLVCPPPVGPITEWAELYAGAEEKSRALPPLYEDVAERVGCEFLDAGAIVRNSPLDGWHIDGPEHRKLGVAIAAKVREMLAAWE